MYVYITRYGMYVYIHDGRVSCGLKKLTGYSNPKSKQIRMSMIYTYYLNTNYVNRCTWAPPCTVTCSRMWVCTSAPVVIQS